VRFIGGFQLEEKKKETEDRVRRGLDGLVFLKGHVPYNQSIRAMVRADLLLLLDTPGQRAGVPAKLYEYVGAGRSILALAALDSDVAWVLRESGVAHRVAAPLDAEAIRRALTELLQDPAIARRSGLQFPIQTRFTRERHGCELVAVLDSGRGALPSTDGEPIRAKPSSPERTLDLPFRHES